MPVTIKDICALPDLDLSLVAGVEGADLEVRWVHVSEVTDPTPWLQGGELLLTTGLRVDSTGDFRDYVARLSDAKLAGIGFGVGLEHGEVPAEMIEAANERGIPVIRIPVETPYMAISEAVSNMIAADRYDAISRALDAQQQITRAALGSGHALIKELSRHLQGWVIQADAAGDVIYAWPPDAPSRMPGLMPDLVRSRESGGRSASSIITPGASTVVQPISVDGLPRGFLLAGVERPLGPFERTVLASAIGLLTLEMERSRKVSDRLHRQRSTVLAQALRDRELSPESARQLMTWGVDAAAMRICVFLAPPQKARGLLDGVISLLTDADTGGAAALVPHGEDARVVVVVSNEDDIVNKLRDLADVGEGIYLGLGDLSPIEDLQRNYRGAVHAASIGRTEQQTVTQFAELAAMQLLLRTSSPAALYSFLERVLGPLMADKATGKNIELRRTLEVFLSCNGRWGEAADQLQVHRHTLRTRMEKIADATGRHPDSAYARMELWLALLIEESFGPHLVND